MALFTHPCSRNARPASSSTFRAARRPTRSYVRLALETLERRDLLSFGSLVQAGLSQTPFTNTSDINGQSGTVTLNSEVEPSIAANPGSPKHLVGVWQQDRWSNGGARGIVAGVSDDGGNTWTRTLIPGATVNSGGSAARASDPWVSIGPDGTVYASYLELPDPNAGNPTGVFISTSYNGGFTWNAPTPAITNIGDRNIFDDKDSITADPDTAGVAYVVWDRLYNAQNLGPAMFSRTTDFGRTWSNPVQIANPVNGQTLGNQIVVLPGGVLVDMAVIIDYATNATTIVVMRSTDRGASWSGPITVNSVQAIDVTDPNNGVNVRAGEGGPSIAVDPVRGNMYIVWQDARFSGNAHDDIAFSVSTNGGLSWSSPIKANQTPASIPSGEQQAFNPSVAVTAGGLVGVSYYDFRYNPGAGPTQTDYWVAFADPSQPNVTFGNEQRLTDNSFNLQLAPNAGGEFLGDYEALVRGGNTGNTLSAFFAQTVSPSTPTAIFYRGIVPPTATTSTTTTMIVAGNSSNAVFALGSNGNLYWYQPGGWIALGSFIATASATVDAAGNPVVFAVTAGHDLFSLRPGGGWQRLGGAIQSVSATSEAGGRPVVFAVTVSHDLFRFDGRWGALGSSIRSVTAAVNGAGQAVVFATTTANDLFRFDASGWRRLGSSIISASATTTASGQPVVFAITSAHDLFRFDASTGWTRLGSFIQSVSAGTGGSGNPKAYAITVAGAAYADDIRGVWTALNLAAPVQSIAGGTVDRLYAVVADGSVVGFDDVNGWVSLGNPAG